MIRIIGAFLLFVTPWVFAAEQPKNIIMVIGDGMGPVYTSGYRYYADDPATPVVETTIFDELLVGLASTYPAPESGVVTDSAAGATALSSGVKSYNGAIGVDVNRKPLPTVLELAKQRGMKTGIAVTSQINHATPAAYMAHNESRNNYNEIADSYFDDRLNGHFKADVMLGGGWAYFIRPGRNLVAEFQEAGFQYVDSMAALTSAPVGKPLLGLFADKGLPWALDYPDHQRLPLLAKTAVKHLQGDQGFFLLIEASQVDWGGHANDVAAAMGEMDDMAITLEWLKQFVDADGETLLVVTADHSTGGISLGSSGKYEWHPEVIRKLEQSPTKIAEQLLALPMGKRAALLKVQLGAELNAEEATALAGLTDARSAEGLVKKLIDRLTNTGWTTGGHTAVDVPVMAYGMGAEQFRGHQDNTEIAKKVIALLPEK
ncbi:alkaline phosphatase [Halioxenophilus sp. WMMB6]|uniref:alkaline phosphatase n=1 Tax=Halioxenophilus sp. WMMB6 TaxID=3073815 RepID=UPI00295F4ADC|nr:alkaline phosphatase [Halioxenophilus sp. WMMB6]